LESENNAPHESKDCTRLSIHNVESIDTHQFYLEKNCKTWLLLHLIKYCITVYNSTNFQPTRSKRLHLIVYFVRLKLQITSAITDFIWSLNNSTVEPKHFTKAPSPCTDPLHLKYKVQLQDGRRPFPMEYTSQTHSRRITTSNLLRSS